MNIPADISIDMWMIAKGAIVFFLFLYGLFAWIVVRQAKIMSETIILTFGDVFTKIAYGHFAVSLLVLILSLIIL